MDDPGHAQLTDRCRRVLLRQPIPASRSGSAVHRGLDVALVSHRRAASRTSYLAMTGTPRAVRCITTALPPMLQMDSGLMGQIAPGRSKCALRTLQQTRRSAIILPCGVHCGGFVLWCAWSGSRHAVPRHHPLVVATVVVQTVSRPMETVAAQGQRLPVASVWQQRVAPAVKIAVATVLRSLGGPTTEAMTWRAMAIPGT